MKAETIIGPASIIEKPFDGMFALTTKTLLKLSPQAIGNSLRPNGGEKWLAATTTPA